MVRPIGEVGRVAGERAIGPGRLRHLGGLIDFHHSHRVAPLFPRSGRSPGYSFQPRDDQEGVPRFTAALRSRATKDLRRASPGNERNSSIIKATNDPTIPKTARPRTSSNSVILKSSSGAAMKKSAATIRRRGRLRHHHEANKQQKTQPSTTGSAPTPPGEGAVSEVDPRRGPRDFAGPFFHSSADPVSFGLCPPLQFRNA
jgi:hypothetical protein